MNFQPSYGAYTPRSISMQRRQSYGLGIGGGYDQDLAYFPGSTPYVNNLNYSTPMHMPAYAGGALSRYPSRRSYNDSRDSPYFDDDYEYDQGIGLYSYPNKLTRRHRHHSSSGYRGRHSTPFLDSFRRPTVLKFKVKGSYHSGITLGEALDNVRLSGDKTYSHRDLNTDSRGNLYMKIMWNGYPPLTYEIPVDGYDGRMSLQTLMRRISRACIHYFQSRAIPMHTDRILLHSIEEVTPGTWQPVMTIQ